MKAGSHTDVFRPTNGWLAGIVLAVLTFWLFAQTLLNVIPVVQDSLGIETTLANFAVSISSLFAGVFVVIAGGLADRFGRVKMLRAGIILSIIGSLLVALTPEQAGGITTAMLMGGRIIQGLSSAAVMPAALALIKNYYEGKERQRAVSFFSIGTFGGSGITAFFGGAMASSPLGWRSIFWVSIIACIVALYLVRGTPETRAELPEDASFDWVGVITFLVGLIALNVVISQGPKLGWLSSTTLVLAVVAVAGLAAFAVVEFRKLGKSPFIDFGIFANPAYAGATLANCLINGTAGILLLTLSLAQKGAGLTSFQAGLLTLGYLLAILTMIRVGGEAAAALGR